MSERTLERQPAIEHDLADEQAILRQIQLLRQEQEMEGLHDRVLQFEESGGIRIVSYNDYEKETVFRDPEGKEQVDVTEITVDEKNELDNMYDIVQEYEHEEMNMDDVDIPNIEFDDEKDMDDDFGRDERDDIDRDEEMDYE
jgi:hypothetical protein